MDLLELKFLLTLLGFPDYKAPITDLQVDRAISSARRDSICRQLSDRDFVGCNYEISSLKITPAGRALLKLDTTGLPVTEQELKVLQTCAAGTTTPGQIRMAAATKQQVIQALADRGLLETEKRVKQVWLTDRGGAYLRDEYRPSGSPSSLAKGTLSLDLLDHYLVFLRKALPGSASPKGKSQPIQKPNDGEILLLIRQLNQELGSQNYLPLFHLRQRLQPPFERQELDQALYRLQRQDQIELGALQETLVYTPEQVEAGIPQDIGGPLFFISISEP